MFAAECLALTLLLTPAQLPNGYIPGQPPAPPVPFEPLIIPADPPGVVGEDRTITNPPPDYECRRWNPFYYVRHNLHHGMGSRHHQRFWTYIDSQHHGYPYGMSTYAGRADGASFTFGQWVPRRSYYYAYQPGGMYGPYGHTVEPYYAPKP